MSDKKKDPYRDTLNLPKTSFGMKANLIQNEPQFQKRWDKLGVYEHMRKQDHPKGAFVFHDGPPYANGSIHLGHLLNKTLKDLVVRSKLMAGYDVDFVPGWDCHGLPIEHRVMKELGDKAKSLNTLQLRGKCRSYAEKFQKTQQKQMQRLGTIGNYDDPYLTMNPRYEGAVLDVFADLVERKIVYRDLKPVHWSIENQTALADAELEYHDREDTSVYVLFEIQGSLPGNLNAPQGKKAHVMIWTTTPWTLPANLAVAVSPTDTYTLCSFNKDGRDIVCVLGSALDENVLKAGGVSEFKRLGSCTGQDLADAEATYQHPFVAREGRILVADYVTQEDGTGLVHTAPGHGEEDYQTGMREGLDIYCPVCGDGTYDDSVPDWLQGQSVWKANALVTEHLRASGHLFFDHKFTHSYPHDWRSKTPTIFRATDQWFISVQDPVDGGGSLRERALAAVKDDINFVPDWGARRLGGMLESRPDWCISRQRVWGLPIPGFVSPNGETILTTKIARHVANVVREHGSNQWFKCEPAELLEGYDPRADNDAPAWLKDKGTAGLSSLKKVTDIFDVWFESGSSWNAVLRTRNIGFPADLYLEGSDQHRGWFQLSLLPALGVTGKPPFKTLLTHGFMVDAKGHKMSKSEGNAVDVDDLLEKYGADIARWWVCSLNYTNDIKVDWEFFKHASEEYRKVRNTLRFLMGNLNGFDPKNDRVTLEAKDDTSMDGWARWQLDELILEVTKSYEAYQYRRVREAIFNFCNDTMSAVYMHAAKDRLYCEKEDSRKRRRTQTVMFDIADALIRMLAPVLVHTADEAYLALHGLERTSDQCVHFLSFPQPSGFKPAQGWDEVMAIRTDVLKVLEAARDERDLKNPLDAGVVVTVPQEQLSVLEPFVSDLVDLCGVSRLEVVAGAPSCTVNDLRGEPRCERSWKRDTTVKQRSDGGWLTDRDADAVGVS